MRKTLIISSFILMSVWIVGISSIKISQNQSESESATEKTKPVLTEKTPPLNIATTTKIIKKSTKEGTQTTTKVENSTKTIIEPTPDFEAINTFARKAVVNILCTVKGKELSPISGTGVIISENGIVLTNAHVAQYFLLRDLYVKDYITCVLRTGSPAYPTYNVELVYISPIWVKLNKSILKDENPAGTGENDYAFLRITSKIDGSSLPNLPYIYPNAREIITLNEPVVLVSYPAGFLGGLSILKDLHITSGITAVRDYYTYKDSFIDLISIPGTVVSQKGSSGGAVVDKNSTVIGIISTSSKGETTGERDLSAITLGYINRALKNESGINLLNFLSGDVSAFAKNFRENEAPALTKIIIDELKKTN